MTNIMDTMYIAYFALHIPITLLVDAAIALPLNLQFAVQKKLVKFHIESNSDWLVATPPFWFQAFVWVEIILQIPFFFWAIHDLSHNKKRIWPAMLAYGIEASTTTLACLAEVVCGNDANATSGISKDVRTKLLGLYLPTFIIPLIMSADFGWRITKELNRK